MAIEDWTTEGGYGFEHNGNRNEFVSYINYSLKRELAQAATSKEKARLKEDNRFYGSISTYAKIFLIDELGEEGYSIFADNTPLSPEKQSTLIKSVDQAVKLYYNNDLLAQDERLQKCTNAITILSEIKLDNSLSRTADLLDTMQLLTLQKTLIEADGRYSYARQNPIDEAWLFTTATKPFDRDMMTQKLPIVKLSRDYKALVDAGSAQDIPDNKRRDIDHSWEDMLITRQIHRQTPLNMKGMTVNTLIDYVNGPKHLTMLTSIKENITNMEFRNEQLKQKIQNWRNDPVNNPAPFQLSPDGQEIEWPGITDQFQSLPKGKHTFGNNSPEYDALLEAKKAFDELLKDGIGENTPEYKASLETLQEKCETYTQAKGTRTRLTGLGRERMEAVKKLNEQLTEKHLSLETVTLTQTNPVPANRRQIELSDLQPQKEHAASPQQRERSNSLPVTRKEKAALPQQRK